MSYKVVLVRYLLIWWSDLVQYVVCPFNTNEFHLLHLNQDELIDALIVNGHIKSKRVERAMRYVLIDHFHKPNPRARIYNDLEKEIGYEAIVESPSYVAEILENFKPWLHVRSKVLDIGSGAGYLSALFAYLTGSVVGVEHVANLIKRSTKNIRRGAPAVANANNIKFVCQDGRAGYIPEAPYDIIYISGAMPGIPWHIVPQLKPNGRMIWINGHDKDLQTLEMLDKFENGSIKTTIIHPSVYFAPLMDLDDQMNLCDAYNTPPTAGPYSREENPETRIVPDISADIERLNISKEYLITERPCDVSNRRASTIIPLRVYDLDLGGLGPYVTRAPGYK